MRILDFILVVLLIGALGYSLYMLYQNIPGEPIELIPVDSTISKSITLGSLTGPNTSTQFYPSMRFRDRTISYKTDSSCSQSKKSLVEQAFEDIESLTVLNFYPATNAEIEITCSEIAPDPKTKRHFVAGEGGPVEIINTTLYSVILKGKISLYRDESCGEPKIATHEIFHVLGFDHNSNPQSILYPTLDCEQKIDSYLIEEINSLYSVNKAPDLAITSLEATLSGRYLSFDIEVSNQGLDDAQNAGLDVYSDSDLIETFDLGDIEIGTKKILTVKNLRASRSTENVEFVVAHEGGSEITSENNKQKLVIN